MVARNIFSETYKSKMKNQLPSSLQKKPQGITHKKTIIRRTTRQWNMSILTSTDFLSKSTAVAYGKNKLICEFMRCWKPVFFTMTEFRFQKMF